MDDEGNQRVELQRLEGGRSESKGTEELDGIRPAMKRKTTMRKNSSVNFDNDDAESIVSDIDLENVDSIGN